MYSLQTKVWLLNITSYFLLITLLFSCGNSELSDYQIKGKLTNSSGEMVSLIDVNSPQAKTIDSVKVNEKGEFYFTKKVSEKGFYNLQISPSSFATLIIDSTEKVSFEADAKNINDSYTVDGSPDTKLYIQFNNFTKTNLKERETIRINQDSLQKVYEAYLNTTPDSLSLDSLEKMLEPIFNKFSVDDKKYAEEISSHSKKFINENVSSFASLTAMRWLNPEKDIAYFIKVDDALTAKYPNIETLKGFKTYVDGKKKLAIGSPAPEISMNNKDGKLLSLSSMKGKVVIVDFWASWCKPCRVENPFIVSLYNKYKNKRLDIFSVSLDMNKDAWLNAIAQDKLVWKNHVTDLKQWQSPVVSLYGFQGIPFTVLLDKQGNIAGKNLRGPELEEKIKELLN